MKIALIRHFATAGNLKKQYIGKTDEPILMQEKEKEYPYVQKVIISPMLRCRQTAEILYPDMDKIECPKFRECDFGKFEGKSYRDLNGDPSYQAWIDSGGTDPFPEGESQDIFSRRVTDGFEKMVDLLFWQRTEKAAMVVHGGTIMAILEKFEVSGRSYFDWHCGNGCGYLIRIDENEWKTGEKRCKVEQTL